jgi:hypothetical protein
LEKVTEAVHNEGGTIIAQIWHVGRASHHELTGGMHPQAPSAIRAEGLIPRFRKPYDMPEEMSKDDIKEVVGLMYSTKLTIFGVFFGTIFLPMLFLIPGLFVGFLIRSILKMTKIKDDDS